MFYVEHLHARGKKPVYVERKTEIEPTDAKAVRAYDEGYLFHLFCCVNGRIPELLKFIETLPVESRARIPRQATLYKIANQNDWRIRFEEIRKKIREDLNSRNALTYAKIDQFASYFMQGVIMRAVKSLREENFNDFNYKDLKAIWSMSRVERGLADSVPYRDQNHSLYREQIEELNRQQKYMDSSGGAEFYDRLKDMTPEEGKRFRRLFLGDDSNDDGIPSIIRRNRT